MMNPTRINLLFLRDKLRSVNESIEIMKARRQALLKEFMSATAPFLRSRAEIRSLYGKGVTRLRLSLGHEGGDFVHSIALAARPLAGVTVVKKNVWGLKYKEVEMLESPRKGVWERAYDPWAASPEVDEAADLFEKTVEAVSETAKYESKLKRLGEEIRKTTRRVKILEDVIRPGLKKEIRTIRQSLDERERESLYRLRLSLKRIQKKRVG